jgi:hypothetical protein
MHLFNDLQALYALHLVDNKILRARATLAALDNGATLAAAYNAKKAEADPLRTAANKALAEQKDAELKLASIEAKAAQTHKSLFGGKVTTPKELENLQLELDSLGRQKAATEDKVLEAMETSGTRVSLAEAAEAELAAIAAKYRAVRAAYKKRHDELSAEIAGYERERAGAVSSVPAALLARYDGIRAKKSGVGAAPLQDDGSCGACHTRLNSDLVDDVKAAEAVQVCEHCGRILIRVAPA